MKIEEWTKYLPTKCHLKYKNNVNPRALKTGWLGGGRCHNLKMTGKLQKENPAGCAGDGKQS